MENNIKPEELRRWNVVQDIDRPGQYLKVLEINEDTVRLQITTGLTTLTSYNRLRPIPLSEDILLRCGFEKVRPLVKTFFKRGSVEIWQNADNEWILGMSSESGYGKIWAATSLHWLQNWWYMWYNKELEIQL